MNVVEITVSRLLKSEPVILDTINKHHKIVIEQDTDATIIDELYSKDRIDSDSVLEVEISEGSKLSYISLQSLSNDSNNLIKRKIILKKGSELNFTCCTLGAKTHNSVTDIYLDEGADANYSEAFFSDKNQNFNISANLYHRGKHTRGKVVVKGILKGSSRSIFKGIIRIEKGAEQADSFLAEHTILLDKDARSDSIPSLEIKANEVRCTHSSSMSRIDIDHIFYLMSRGISKEEATRCIALGFLSTAINNEQLMEKVSLKWEND